ncbi:hypothetical protein F4805DRAFT_459111 [Annulohypoxylon moriforme]|nr:hypothetical protein F4805DRAFT_459111 [Annulohypoxylon moriforme]
MKPPVPSATPTWHNDTYDAISPNRPELSASGKKIAIIGAGSGIGRETARAFAAAGAGHVALLGRREALLDDTGSQVAHVNPNTFASIHVADITQETDLKFSATMIGEWDVNTKGTFQAIKSFLPTANPSHAAVLAVTSGMATTPAKNFVRLSSYMTSKLAQIKILEFLALEQPHIFAATVHPGMIETDIFKKAGGDASRLPMDTGKSYICFGGDRTLVFRI